MASVDPQAKALALDRLRVEFEASPLSERTKDSLEAARARGRTGGQKPKLGARQAHQARLMYEEAGADGRRRYTVAQIAAEFGVSRPSIYRYLSKPAGGPAQQSGEQR